MTRPRILFISPRMPYPLNSGTKIRISHLIRGLAQVGDVDLIGYGFPLELDDLLGSLSNTPDWWSGLHSIRFLPHPPWHATEPPLYQRRLGRRFFSRTGLIYSTFPGAPLSRHAAPLAARADLVWTERLYTALGLRHFADKTIVDLDDLESVKTAREAESNSLAYMRWSMKREAARLARMERAAIEQFSRVAVCSAEDARFFGKASDQVWVVPNGVDDELMLKPALPRDSHRLVFVGTMNYGPNEDAMLYFCREIFPRILAQIPDATLSIVGLKPLASILALQDDQNIFVHANVPEVAPYVQGAAVSIVPLRVGGGTRLKILESLALGTPVVSTTVGAEGLAFNHNEHLLLADSPADFAEAVVRMLLDFELNRRLAIQGRDRVKQLYLWSTIRNRVATQCENMLRSKTRNAA